MGRKACLLPETYPAPVAKPGCQRENTRLQSKVLRFDMGVSHCQQTPRSHRAVPHRQPHPRHDPAWVVKPGCLQENTRLQSKVLRFDMGVTVPQPLGADGRALLEELREENGQLRDDNDKLVEYLEKLEAKLNSGANTPAAAEPSGGLLAS